MGRCGVRARRAEPLCLGRRLSVLASIERGQPSPATKGRARKYTRAREYHRWGRAAGQMWLAGAAWGRGRIQRWARRVLTVVADTGGRVGLLEIITVWEQLDDQPLLVLAADRDD